MFHSDFHNFFNGKLKAGVRKVEKEHGEVLLIANKCPILIDDQLIAKRSIIPFPLEI